MAKVSEILALAKGAGAQVGSPYSTISKIAENVEGNVVRRQGVSFEAYQLVVKDETGELRVNISSQSYAPGKTKYDLAIQNLDRDLTFTNAQGGQGKIERNTKMLRAI